MSFSHFFCPATREDKDAFLFWGVGGIYTQKGTQVIHVNPVMSAAIRQEKTGRRWFLRLQGSPRDRNNAGIA